MAMALPAIQLDPSERYFLGVERSLSGRAWKDRLDERGSARALAIAQRHGLDELLARV
jgi:single-stranded-DNA-specific exonuclease